MKVLVVGASGMLGNAMVRVLNEKKDWEIHGTLRSNDAARFFSHEIAARLTRGVDVENHDALVRLFAQIRPDVVINCIGLIKQLADAGDPLQAIPINSLLPHRLAKLCELAGARLVHMSTDCVFSGKKGNYTEADPSDADDLYGKSKYLGEVDLPHAITLRTSIIGHELQGAHSLIGWFLSQENQCKGYTKAIYSGLPAVVLAQIVRDVIIPHTELSGIYHVASKAISKHDLLHLVAEIYGKQIRIIPDDSVQIDRSLNPEKFRKATGYVAPEWKDMIELMHSYR
jgi:dTDP-4-dehydrorhamnose reductase